MGGRYPHDHLIFSATILLIAAVSTLAGPRTASAGEQTPLSNRCLGALEQVVADADYNGDDLTRPECKFQILLEGKTSGTTSKTDTVDWNLQVESIFDLKSVWGFSWLVKVPIASKSAPVSGSSTDLDRDFGIGDIELQAVLFRPINERWAYGFGVRSIVPSGGENLGSEKWQIMPGFGIRYSFLELGRNTYFVPQIRYAQSIGGDPSRRNISEAQIAPTFSIGLPNRWFVTLFPSYDIRINFGEPSSGQTGRLFFPIDAMIGRKVSDNVVVSLEGSVPVVKDYPVYNFKTELRMSAKF